MTEQRESRDDEVTPSPTAGAEHEDGLQAHPAPTVDHGDADDMESTPAPTENVDTDELPADAIVPGAEDPVTLVLVDQDRGIDHRIYGLPVRLGRGVNCDVALEGQGPEGVYARIIEDEYGFLVEQIRPAVRIAVNRDDVQRAYLSNGDMLYVDDRVFAFQWREMGVESHATRRHNRRKLAIVGYGAIALALIIVGGAWLLRLMAPDVEAPTKAEVPALDIERTSRLNPLAEALADAASWEPGSVEVDLSGVEERLAPTALMDAVRRSWAASQEASAPTEPSPSREESDSEPESPAGPDAAEVGATARARGMRLYRSGEAARAAAGMRAAAQRPVMSGTPDAAGLEWLADRVDHGVGLYQSIGGSLEAGRLLAADGQLDELAGLERDDLKLGEPSVYYKRARTDLTEAMADRMRVARAASNDLSAYRWATEVLELREHAEARAVVERLDRAAEARFSKAHRLEPVDLMNASRMWREVTRMVPPMSPWHRRAVAKLNQHQRPVE